jgi:flagellar hook-associated protein 3 FlgL
VGQDARDALATELDQIRQGVLADANTSYLGRPVFGGTTAGTAAYDATGAYVGDGGQVNRTIGDGEQVRVDTDGQAAFGPAGDNVFDHLDALTTALRTNDTAGISAGLTALAADATRVANAHAAVGSVYNRVDAANQAATDGELRVKTSLSDVENIDLPKVMVDLQMQQTAYQAALGSTAKVIQPSLLDFLR